MVSLGSFCFANFGIVFYDVMSNVFITGSADGLGQMAARILINEGHNVWVHGRNEHRAEEAMGALPGVAGALSGDLSQIKETILLACRINRLGKFDAIIHNAGVGFCEPKRRNTRDGLPEVFAVNSLAPYLLTALIKKPTRLIYISSALHFHGDVTLKDLTWEKRTWNGFQAYADSKFHNLLLSQTIARVWPQTLSNAVEPGWVSTKMGGPDAIDDLTKAPVTQAWLAVSHDKEAMANGRYFYHQRARAFHQKAADPEIQDAFLDSCKKITGVSIPLL